MAKIILAQIDSTIGRLEANKEKIITLIDEAKNDNADAIIFPQYSLTSTPCGDIFKRHNCLFNIQSNAIEEIKQAAKGITVILGVVGEDYLSKIMIINNQTILSADEVVIAGETYKVISGEYDALNSSTDANIIHVSSSSSRCGKEFLKDEFISSAAKNNAINYIYVNSVGYSDNRVYDGASRIYDKNGNLTARAKSFEEDYLITDNFGGRIEPIPAGAHCKVSESFDMNYENDLDRLYKELICGIKGYFSKNGFTKAVLGLSGGLDSTICAVLLVDALGKDNVVGISMPTRISSQGSKDDAKELANNLGITYIESPIANEVEVFKSELNKVFEKVCADKYNASTTFENIQARTRATLLWSISNEYRGMLPIATSDKSEGYIGYATTNGDMSGGFAPISDVTKTKLFALGDYLNKNRAEKNAIPQNVLEKPPGAELKFDKEKGRTVTAEEDNMPYPFLDEAVFYIEKFGYGYDELMAQKFFYETNHNISLSQKEEWLKKFYNKHEKAVFKWHLMPPGIITEFSTINQSEYYHPIV
ncbi:MAG: NAD(+) synthase [bacterium]|nr:NAD(+) synthase [bacterium]